jgi:carbon monoxide dehydrogenase subunit G
MELADGVTVSASRQRVWAFLVDATQLSSCLRGLEAVEIAADGSGFGGAATFSLGSLVLRFPTRVEWLEQEPPERGRLRALAKISGHEVVGEGTIELSENRAGTAVQWQVALSFPAALQENAMLAPLAQNVATTLIQGFFTCLQERLKDISTV